MNDQVQNPLFDQYFDKVQGQEARRRSTQLILGTGDPAQTAEAVGIGEELGVLPQAVLGAPEQFKGMAAQKRATTALQSAPLMAEWLGDPVNGALAKDDLENLTWFEREMGPLARAAGRGTRRASVSDDVAAAQLQGAQAADIGRSYDEIYAEELAKFPGSESNPRIQADARRAADLRFDRVNGLGDAERVALIKRGAENLANANRVLEMTQGIPMSDTASQFRDGTLANSENTLMGALGAFISDPVGGAAFIAETAAETLPILAAATGATLATRSPGAGVATMSAGSFLLENSTAAIGFLQEKGVDLSSPEAAALILQDRELMAEATELGVQRGMIIAIFDAVSGGVAGQQLANSPAGDVVVQGIAQIVLGGGGEATAQLATEGEIDAREVVIEGLAELATAPIEVVGVGGRGLIREVGRYARSGDTAGVIDQVDAVAEQSQVKAASIDRFADALQAAQLNDHALYVPAEDLQEYFQSKNTELDDETLRAWGVEPDDFREKLLSGGDVTVPVANYAARISGTEDAAWFRNHSVFSIDEMSVAEAEQFNDRIRDVMDDAFEKAQAEAESEANLRAADVQIYDQMFSDLRAAGRSPDVADNEARVWSSFWRTMGERYGEDPLELARSMGVRVQSPQTPEARRQRDLLDIQLNTLRSQGERALQPRGQGVLEFVRGLGGVRDLGGDVEALDVPAGVIGETRSQIIERTSQPRLDLGLDLTGRGLELDEIGRRLIEAGYFQGQQENADGTTIDEASLALELISEAAGGRETFIPGEGPDQDLTELMSLLSERGIDLALSNDEIAAALEGESEAKTFDQDKRGSIQMPRGGLKEGQTVINLFEAADLSTFLHESGHFFLEAFTALATADGAPAAMQDDLAAIHKFLGVENSDAIGTDQHETWARGFEAYLMEGKAPSLELASAFARFKAWLTRIYKTVRGLDVKLTDEIREVMDRLLATDAEIAAMREDMNMRPLFTSDNPIGMSEADFATYQRLAVRSAEQAEQRLLKSTMAKIKRETLKWFKDEKAAVRAQVETSANKMPVYRLTEMLSNKRWIGDANVEIPDMQIDRKALVDQFGEGVLAELSRSRLGGKRAIYANGGESPQLVAEFFGFASVPDMIKALQNAGKRTDFISAEVDRIMVERHGDPLNDGSIEEAAAMAVHSQQQAATVTAEARAIAKRLGRPTQDIKAKLYRQRAKVMLGRMSVREASRPAAFLAAERKAAKTAEQAFARLARQSGQNSEAVLQTAMQAKEQQLLNSFLYQESVEFEKRLNRGREKMRGYAKKSVREKLDGGYIEQIDTLLDRFDFRKRSPGQINKAETLRGYIDRMIAEGRQDDLSIDDRLLDEARRVHYTRLSVDELLGLFDTVQNIDHMGRFKQKLIDRQRKRDLNESAGKVSDLVRKRFGTGKTENQSGDTRNFFNLLMRVDTIAADIDGQEIGDFYDEIKRGLDEGAALEQKMNVESATKLEALFSVYSAKEKADLNTPRDIPGGNGRQWTKQQVLALALNTGNANNVQRALDPRVHEDVRITRDQMDAILATMDKRDWDFVQSVWDFVDEFWPSLAEVTERRTGVKLKREQATPVTTQHGTYRGGYYPIAYDRTKSKQAAQDAESAFDKFLSAGRGAPAKVADGMTQARQNSGGGRALHYDLSVLMRHVRDTARVITMSEPVDNSYRVLNHEDVYQAFLDGGVAHLHQTLNLFLQDIGTGPVYNDDPINGLARIIKNNFTLSRLAFNLKTVALQVTGLGHSAAVIGKMNLLKGFAEYRKRPLQIAEEVMKKSPFMAERQTTFQKDIYDQANDVRLSTPISSRARKAKNFISALGFSPIVKTQFYAVDMPTWLGAYQAEIARNGGNEKAAVHFADRMVDRAQGGGLLTDRNALERGTVSRNMRQSDFVRLWTTLGGYMVTKMNRGFLTVKGAQRSIKGADTATGKVMAAAGAAGDLVLLYVFEAAMMGLAYSLLTDDEDDEEITAFMIREITGAAFGGIPFIRESVGAFNGYGAGGVLSSALEIPSTIWEQATQGENDKAFRRSVADAVGFATGMPTTASMRIIEELIEQGDGSLAEAMIGRNPLAD